MTRIHPIRQNQVRIRPEQVNDYGAIATVHTRAFGQSDQAQLVEKIRHSNHYVSDLALVAEVGSQVIGHVLFSYSRVIGQNTWPVLILAPLSVLPNYQNQGVGCQLVQQGLQIARSLGNSLVTVLGHPRYYSSLGFESACQFDITPPLPTPSGVFRVKWLSPLQDQIRGRLEYSPAFASKLKEITDASADLL